MALNFAIIDAGDYTDVGGTLGSYLFDPGSQILTFSGADLDGQSAVFNSSQNPETITFLNANGDLGDSCDLQP